MGVFSPIKEGRTYRIFLDGKWTKPSVGKKFDVFDPATGKFVASVFQAGREEAELAAKAAAGSQPKIEGLELEERVAILRRAANLLEKRSREFVKTLVAEAGKPVTAAEGEVKATVERLRVTEQEAEVLRPKLVDGKEDFKNKFAIVLRKPRGVVLAISPFNYPLFISCAKIAPALLAGNSVILKPPSDCPVSSLMLARILELAGIPKGCLQVLPGRGAEIGDYLAKHELVSMISFTGNSETGKHIAQVAGMKKLHLELGGKAPAIVLEDADLELAAKEIVAGALSFAGQRCDAVSRVLVVEKVADQLVEKILQEMKQWKVGDPRKKETKVGPLINEKAVQKVEELVRDALQKGAKILSGGRRKGLFFEPTLLDYVTEEMRIAWEETFGPVIPILRVKDEEKAIRIAKASEYALDACVFTQDYRKALELGKKLDEGSLHLNLHPKHGIGIFPFGGNKASGLGREGIGYTVLEMTELKTVVFPK